MLPTVGQSNWGTTLNNFLLVSHNNDGSIKNTTGSGGITHIEVLSQAAYDAIASKNATTLYIIT
jgi:hypothetical protein